MTRLLLLAAGSSVAGALLWVLPAANPPPAAVGDILEWWTDEGTAAATIAIVRGAGMVVAAVMLMLVAIGLAAVGPRSMHASHIWAWLAPAPVRRFTAATVLVGFSANAAAVCAAESGGPPVPILADLGPADDSTLTPLAPPSPVLVDLGAVPRPDHGPTGALAVAPDTPVAGNGSEQWTVAVGDHLWLVAAETLADRGHATTDADVARYWRRLIDANRTTIGPDVDLIHPGLVLNLPGDSANPNHGW